MSTKLEPGDIVLCVSVHGLTDDGWRIPNILERYTIERVFENGDVRLVEVNNDAEDSLSAQFTGRGHSDFYAWRFLKVGHSEKFWMEKIRNSAYERDHTWKDRKITIIKVEPDQVRFHMQGMKHGTFTATKEFLLKY